MPNYKKKFAKLYDKHLNGIYRFVFLKIGSPETAEDLTSQVFTKAWKKFRTGTIENQSAYLYQIARSEIADYYRSQSKFKIISVESASIVDSGPSVEEEQAGKLDVNFLQQVLGRLEDDYQNILIWRYVDGYSIKEIAKIMDKSEGAVRVTIHRALKAAKEEWEKNSQGVGDG